MDLWHSEFQPAGHLSTGKLWSLAVLSFRKPVSNPLRGITTFVLCSQSPLNLHPFCLTRFQIEGWLELIGTPSASIRLYLALLFIISIFETQKGQVCFLVLFVAMRYLYPVPWSYYCSVPASLLAPQIFRPSYDPDREEEMLLLCYAACLLQSRMWRCPANSKAHCELSLLNTQWKFVSF